MLGFIVLLVFLRFVLAATANLAEDEAYYWLWSTHLAAGYYDHPPMIAYWIRAGTAIFGQTAFGVRFVALLSSLAGSYLLYRASLSLFRDANAALLAVLWLNATLLCNAAAIVATPDTPLAFFATLTLFTLAKLIETGKGAWWYGVGAALGLAFMSKYTAVLLLPGVFVWMAVTAEGRRWFARPEPYIGALIAAALVAPVFWWNYAHEWASFAKQAQHSIKDKPANALASVGELIGGQAGLATPLIFGFCAFGSFFALLRGWKRRDARWLLLGGACAPVFLFFLVHAASQKIQPNWPGFIYPAAILAAVHGYLDAVEGARGAALDSGELPVCAMAGHRLHARGVPATGPWRASHRGKKRSHGAPQGLGQAGLGHRDAGGSPRCGRHPDRELCHNRRACVLWGEGAAGAAGRRAHPLCKPARAR